MRVAAVAAFAAGLRPLDPLDDAVLRGAYEPVESAMGGLALDEGPAADPEAAARAFAWDGEAGAVRVETLRRTPRRAVVLVTRESLAGGAVREERLRIVYASYAADGWWRRW